MFCFVFCFVLLFYIEIEHEVSCGLAELSARGTSIGAGLRVWVED